jgi:hypothetical protein
VIARPAGRNPQEHGANEPGASANGGAIRLNCPRFQATGRAKGRWPRPAVVRYAWAPGKLISCQIARAHEPALPEKRQQLCLRHPEQNIMGGCLIRFVNPQ